MAIENIMDKACPNLKFDSGGIDTHCNKLVITPEGYKFWQHTDPAGEVINVQFCKKCGRTRDVFKCINETEWKVCPYNQAEKWNSKW